VLSLIAPPLCWACDALARRDEPLCGECRGSLDWLPSEPVAVAAVPTWAPVAYEGPARALVQALKYRGAKAVAGGMSAQIAARAPRRLRGARALAPVPLHPARLRARGFNQAERLARALSARIGVPVVECLVRTGAPGAQVGRGRGDRMAAAAATFTAPEAAPEGTVLVDDVVTTGATLAACAAAMRATGSEPLGALAYARTPGR
jgi:ComF family protein